MSKTTGRLGLLVALVLGALPGVGSAWAQAPGRLSFEGTLEDAAGEPVNDSVDLTLRLYDAATDGRVVWEELHAGVAVAGGAFRLVLGERTPLQGEFFAAGPVWLGVTVEAGPELAPRQAVTGVPYALHAEQAYASSTLEGMSAADLTAAVLAESTAQCVAAVSAAGYLTAASASTAGFVTAAGVAEAGAAAGFVTAAGVAEAGAAAGFVTAAGVVEAGAAAGFVTEAEALAAVAAAGYAVPGEPLTGDLDLGGHELRNPVIHNSAIAPADPVPGQLWYDTDAGLLRVYGAGAWGALADTGAGVAPDGLDEVSNGILTNEFTASSSAAGLPVAIFDNFPNGSEATLEVVRAEPLRSVEVAVRITHPDARELWVELRSPRDEVVVLHGGGVGDAGGLDRRYPLPTPAASGDLGALVGQSAVGTWRLRVVDEVFSDLAPGAVVGQIEGFSLQFGYLSADEVEVRGGLHATGTVAAARGEFASLAVGGTDLTATLGTLTARLWCLEECGVESAIECHERVCDGVARTCAPGAALPDGSGCRSGLGRCVAGECCVPVSCASRGAECGVLDDGCGGLLSCGDCPEGARCFDWRCCQPETCASLGDRECGLVDDGCGEVLDCGTCGAGATCSAAGHCEFRCGGTDCPAHPLAWPVAACNAQGLCEYRPAGGTLAEEHQAEIFLPPGSFPMGSPAGEANRSSSEGPVHQVTFARGFFLGKYEISVARYEACQAASPGTCTVPTVADWDGGGWGVNRSPDRRDHPQNGLTWEQARAYCAWTGARL
ncbi:MAG: SUMF1/EgtB/PvdO family nonheme iron enzyme, partial [Myxococcota bacterium]|nr:SUMF1/EgtB/PvdO family nonheme iron enzyme [Myxococcota bacterium]